MQTTITKAVIAAATAFGALVEAKAPGTTNAWLQVIGEALAAGALVWYVPNVPKGTTSTTAVSTAQQNQMAEVMAYLDRLDTARQPAAQQPVNPTQPGSTS